MYKGDAQLQCLAIHELGLQLGNHCGDWYIQSSTRLSGLYEHTLNFNVCMVMKEGYYYHLSRQCLTACSFI